MKQYYVIGADGKQQGPFAEDFVRSQYLAGVYKPNTAVWCEGMPQWAPLATVFPDGSFSGVTPYDGPTEKQIGNPFSAMWYVIRNMFKFSGRARRKEYWMAWLGFVLVGMLGGILLSFLAFPVYVDVAQQAQLHADAISAGIEPGMSDEQVAEVVSSTVDSMSPEAREAAKSAQLLGVVLVLICFPLCIVLYITSLSVTCRRLHDLGYSGWLQLISFIPYIGSIVLFILCVLDSKPGPNQYGANPKGL